MRSGQYKLSCAKTKEDERGRVALSGHFKSSCSDFFLMEEKLRTQNTMNVEPFQFSIFKGNDGGDVRSGGTRNVKGNLSNGKKKKEMIVRHRSCENVHFLTKGTVNRVEQKVRSLLLRGDSKRRASQPTFIHGDIFEGNSKMDFHSNGNKANSNKKPRLFAAHSHSALHTLSTLSDNASCLSASSGYSSSSNSSYGSFKSSESVCSSLQRNRSGNSGSYSPVSDINRMISFDNPIYDVQPTTVHHTPEAVSLYNASGTESLPAEDISTKQAMSPFVDPYQDPVARQCKEYFEKRLKSSDTFRRKWSLFISNPDTSSTEKDLNFELISKGDAVIDSKFHMGFDSDMELGVESNFSLSEIQTPKYETKNLLDKKMEELRQEIAFLIQQDDSLFKQLLSLHESISKLKIQNQVGVVHPQLGSGPQALSGVNLSDLDSFTEEEEEEEDEGEEEENEKEFESQTDNSTSYAEESVHRSLPTEFEENKFYSEWNGGGKSVPRNEETSYIEEEDEGHCTDLSLSHSPSSSPSPASTLSSNSSKDCSYSRALRSEMTSEESGSFTRCRKSYAPNARNRRRASSVNRPPKAPQLDYGTTTALVVIHADEDDNELFASSLTSVTSLGVAHDALAYTERKSATTASNTVSPFPKGSLTEALHLDALSKRDSKSSHKVHRAKHSSKIPVLSSSKSGPSASSHCRDPNHDLPHPPYREALIM